MANKKSTTKKRPVGRPTKYKPEYCEMLIEHMKQGFSFETFGAVIGVNKDTLYEWAKSGDFSDAKKMAELHCQMWWERTGMSGLFSGEKEKFSAPVYIFNMKNRFGWTDRTDLKIDGTFQEKKADHDLLRSVDRSELIKLVKKAG